MAQSTCVIILHELIQKEITSLAPSLSPLYTQVTAGDKIYSSYITLVNSKLCPHVHPQGINNILK